MTTKKDGDKNQIITNINYDQNSLSIFGNNYSPNQNGINQTYTKKINLDFIDKIWDFSSMQIGNKSIINKQKGQSIMKTLLFLKRINFKLIRYIMHQMKSLKDSFITPSRALEIFHYPGYVIRLQKRMTNTGKKEKELHAKI